MPRRRKQLKSRKGRQTSRVALTSDFIRREPFSCLKVGTGAATYPIQPSGLGTRITAIADLYGMYRVIRLRVRFHPSVASPTVNWAICYVPGVTDTAPTSYINIVESPVHLVKALNTLQPSAWLNINAKSLSSYETWYKTIVGTPDPAQEVQGNIYANASGAGEGHMLEFEGVIEFRAAVESGATPAMRREKLVLDECTRIQSVLTEGARIAARKAAGLLSPTLQTPQCG